MVTLPATVLSDRCHPEWPRDPNGLASTAWFEWGATTNYGTLPPRRTWAVVAMRFCWVFTWRDYRKAAPIITGWWPAIRTAPTACRCSVYYPLRNSHCDDLARDSLSTTSATLNGSVNPNGLATTAWFEWGTTTNYGQSTTTTNLGSGTYTWFACNLTD